ncbi:MAG: nucleotidyltransferase domain-containing protein [Candidatus Bathyarchaeota archaeon]|uniref:nucleotidyltransferase domain-containing protein n=1 Tax=Candidatus Bathycorpusculum sp. TaxID=2994959 RepID=UPI00283264A6|nr:nucleotidyltransferase domain-containing protein [Candidatus Termiticorpusculum sp.]MCL2257611.1 nucleotidyltransferase domain-containing protein [Candidatus Termiticorpusculum sp.]MCL2291854.1 nucleotidyltransferase domain-containing protein [Candidatus Termiticorpusculum sp.]
MSLKPRRNDAYHEIIYDSKHLLALYILREKAVFLMSALERFHLPVVAHGSVARGDIKMGSDVDVFITGGVQNSFLVETALEQAGIKIKNRFIIQATPLYAMKAYLEIDDEVSNVSFPLMDLRRVEREFYLFGGEITLSQLKADLRVRGVDKRLMFIEPNLVGHVESSVVGREAFVAKALGISVETVQNRVQALTKRDLVGRTGVFLKKELTPQETFELVLKRLSDFNPAVRRRVLKKKS